MRLHHTLTLSPQPGETPASYCSRVARKHGRTARQFAADCGTDFQSIVDGDSLALATLFETCGADQAHFANSTVRRVGDRLFSIGNEQLTRDTMKRAELRACPVCLAEDQRGPDGNLAAYMRAEWLVEAVRVCPRHDRRLEPLATDSQREIHDFAWHLQRRENAAARIVAPEGRTPGGLIAYVIDRLTGRAAPQWLHQMPLHAAIKSAEIVGAAIYMASMRAGIRSRTMIGMRPGLLVTRSCRAGLMSFAITLNGFNGPMPQASPPGAPRSSSASSMNF